MRIEYGLNESTTPNQPKKRKKGLGLQNYYHKGRIVNLRLKPRNRFAILRKFDKFTRKYSKFVKSLILAGRKCYYFSLM